MTLAGWIIATSGGGEVGVIKLKRPLGDGYRLLTIDLETQGRVDLMRRNETGRLQRGDKVMVHGFFLLTGFIPRALAVSPL